MIKDKFFGRDTYAGLLDKRIRAFKDGYRQNIALIGDELVGKTSIAYNLLDKFVDNRILILYLEIRPESLSSFARRFIGILLYNFLINSGLILKEDLGFLIKKSEKYIPKTTEKIAAILNGLEKRKKNNIFTELLSLCETINQETGKSCVVIFDEFHNLENVGIKNLYREWSKLLISHKNTMYIIISSMKFRARTILSNNLSLLFGNFETVVVDPFDIKTCGVYLDQRLNKIDINPGLKDFIIHFTGGCPFYLEIIADSLRKINSLRLCDLLEEMLFAPSGTLNQRFSNYLKRFQDLSHSQDYIQVLYLISSGHNKIKDILHVLRKQRKELIPKINHLIEVDAITRSGDFLKINDRVFAFWLRFVYQEKLKSLTFDAKNQKVFFRDNIEKMISEFVLNSEKPVINRLMELLRLFEDEMVQIDRKKIRLDHFREIKPLELNSRGIKDALLGRSNDNLWIVAFKQDLLTEEDITDFSKECRKYRNKLQRKIIITSSEVDANARLRALEEKIFTWDLGNLNQILDLFYKPRVIV